MALRGGREPRQLDCIQRCRDGGSDLWEHRTEVQETATNLLCARRRHTLLEICTLPRDSFETKLQPSKSPSQPQLPFKGNCSTKGVPPSYSYHPNTPTTSLVLPTVWRNFRPDLQQHRPIRHKTQSCLSDQASSVNDGLNKSHRISI